RGSGVWVATAVGADYYDDCGLYGICDFRTRLSQKVLPTEHACGATLTIRAQEMSDGQLMASCDSLAEEEGRFHELLQPAGNPVPGARKDRLEIVGSNDPEQYKEYAYAVFGNSTAKGGISLEGDPADPANQPRLITYEASWRRPAFEIWNLGHEYVHYLD